MTPGQTKSRGSNATVWRRWASRLWLSAWFARGAGQQKSRGARSGPRLVVRPEGGPAARGLARDGHKSPDPIGAERRDRSLEKRLHRHRRSSSSSWTRAGDLRAGGQSSRASKAVSTRTGSVRNSRPLPVPGLGAIADGSSPPPSASRHPGWHKAGPRCPVAPIQAHTPRWVAQDGVGATIRWDPGDSATPDGTSPTWGDVARLPPPRVAYGELTRDVGLAEPGLRPP